jgi:hypothetical protein
LTSFAVALALIGVAATPAHAATANARLLNGCEDGLGNRYAMGIVVDVRVAGTYPSGLRIVWRVWGDDPHYDDFRAGPYTDIRQLPSTGLNTTVGLCANGNSTFDEDIGQDEIYFGIRIFDLATGAQREVVESNRIVGYF